MSTIYDLSWGKTSFTAKVKLFSKANTELRKTRSSDRQVRANAYSALSSTYYSIVGTAVAQLKAAVRSRWLAPAKLIAWCTTWLPLAVWCYFRMLPLSDKRVKLVGYGGMSADQCDVRQSVLRRRGQYEEAEFCIRVALGKNPEQAHTRGLLRVGLAEVYWHEGDRERAREETRAAVAAAERAEHEDPRQAARIYRHCAELYSRIGANSDYSIFDLNCKARKLAQATSAEDQFLKM